jgi:hypothetical protein
MQGFCLAGIHYRQELVKCGKSACKRCPHGPYWYAYHYLKIFMKKTYVGKELPPEVAKRRPDWMKPPAELLDRLGRRG